MSTNTTALSSIDFSSIFKGILAVPRPFTAPRVVADSGSGGKACPEMDPIPGYEKAALTDGEGMMWHCFTYWNQKVREKIGNLVANIVHLYILIEHVTKFSSLLSLFGKICVFLEGGFHFLWSAGERPMAV